MSERLEKLSADQATAIENTAAPITIGGQAWPREDALAVLGNKLDTLPMQVHETTRVPIGIYRGLNFGLILHSQFPPDIFLEGAIVRRSTLSRDHHGPRAVHNALERLANAYGSECDRVRQDLAIAEAQLRDYRARLGKPFPHDAYLSELTGLRDQLKASLGHAREPDSEGTSASDLAGKIKALKGAHSIEAAPQRDRPKHSRAEEPVTARIRPRHENSSINDDGVAPEATRPKESGAQANTSEIPMFQKRLAQERQQLDEQGPKVS